MTNFNAFRAYPDLASGTSERKRVRLGASIVSASVVIIGLASTGVTLMNGGTDTSTSRSHAVADPAVRILARAGEHPEGKSCDDQTWPYIEQRCLKRADGATRSTPKHGLAAEPIPLPGTVQASLVRPEAAAVETTGSASPREPDNSVVSPRPVSNPAPAAHRMLGTDAASQRLGVTPHEARRIGRDERTRIQREERDEAKRLREERSRARGEAREAGRQGGERGEPDRAVRRWTEYPYRPPSGGARGVIVIRQGLLDDDFFRAVR